MPGTEQPEPESYRIRDSRNRNLTGYGTAGTGILPGTGQPEPESYRVRDSLIRTIYQEDKKMKKDLTELVFILDRSGSMAGMEGDTIGGFNAMIEKQKKMDGEAYVSTVLFSNSSEVIHDRVRLADIPLMTEKDYAVGGCTALIDAIGGAIRHIENIHKYIRPEDVPEHTMFIITTDGLENASRRYDSASVKKMIEEKKKNGWEFIFLGANIDAVETAAHLGIDREKAVTYTCDGEGTRVNFAAVGEAVCSMRAEGCVKPDWKKNVEENHKKRRTGR